MHKLSYLEACVIGVLQGITELFPVSSLGHSVIIPALIGGSWKQDLNVSTPESPYLAFIVALHVATALALILFFWRDWLRIIRGLVRVAITRKINTSDERLGVLIVIATIPVSLTGLLLEHTFRTTFGKPGFASVFLFLNGLILLAAERLRRKSVSEQRESGSDERLAKLSFKDAGIVGSAQIAALAAGISRSGTAMTAGLLRGLSHEDAARFSFLLATPVILAAGILKIPDLFGPLGDGIRAQAFAGAACAFVAALISIKFLTKWFETRTLTPFGIYCLVAGAGTAIKFAIGA